MHYYRSRSFIRHLTRNRPGGHPLKPCTLLETLHRVPTSTTGWHRRKGNTKKPENESIPESSFQYIHGYYIKPHILSTSSIERAVCRRGVNLGITVLEISCLKRWKCQSSAAVVQSRSSRKRISQRMNHWAVSWRMKLNSLEAF